MKTFIFAILAIFLNISHGLCSDRISLTVNDGDLRTTLHAIAAMAGKNFIVDDSVHGRITINLQNKTIEEALSLISSSHNLDYLSENDVILIATTDKLSKNCRLASVYKLNYAGAAEIKNTLTNLFPAGKLSSDPVTNSIIFSGPPEENRLLAQLISKLDIPTKQVTLEAKLIAVSNEHSKKLGLSWFWDDIPQASDSAESATNKGSLKFSRNYAFRFNAALNALIADGKAKLLAKPKIIALPGKEAKIFIGDHIPVQTEKHGSDGTYISTEYLDAGIKLLFTPIISQDDTMITASVHTEISTPTLISELKNYRITSRTADTNVRLKNGETLIIGGLINEDEQNTLQKIPLLADLPFIGGLFKNTSRSKNKTEVIILLTPYVTAAGAAPNTDINMSKTGVDSK